MDTDGEMHSTGIYHMYGHECCMCHCHKNTPFTSKSEITHPEYQFKLPHVPSSNLITVPRSFIVTEHRKSSNQALFRYSGRNIRLELQRSRESLLRGLTCCPASMLGLWLVVC